METHQRRSALLLGATGLVGSEILNLLERDGSYDRIVIVTRRPLAAFDGHPTIRQAIVDFDHLGRYANDLRGDDVYCAFGTTMRKAGSREQFSKVDLEYPKQLAMTARSNGASHFLLVSSKGASSGSSNFYLHIKGQLEQALEEMDWPNLTILQPSVIGGDRSESRPLERLGQMLLSVAPSSIRTVPASSIARVMVDAGRRPSMGGTRRIESAEILSIARSLQ
ncbi:MAG: NAD-dependent epimerase/dehydratase family protein [Rhodothermia bacterium]|nr:NAD-dependent epimerase/dehydratase family protein [Rhodothermia bacterium]